MITFYRATHDKEWKWRNDLDIPEIVGDPVTVVCVREVEEVVGHCSSTPRIGPQAISVPWHVALVRNADGRILATKVLYGDPPPAKAHRTRNVAEAGAAR